MAKKKHFTAEKKVEILREYLKNKTPVSDLAERYGAHPNSIHQWEKQLFEGAHASFDNNRGNELRRLTKRQRQAERKAAALNEVIAELMQENLKLKKANGGT